MVLSVIALGANLAGRFASAAEAVEAALGVMDAEVARIVARSRLYRSDAWPDPRDPPFVNAVAMIETDDAPAALLARLHRIEAEFGRIRKEPNAPRPLDLDIVDYGGRISVPLETPILPHPRLVERAFVLLPLKEAAPRWRHPISGASVDELIAALPDPRAAAPL